MDCTKAKELINQYMDGRLEEVEILALKEHIKTCSVCAKVLSQYERLAEEIHGLSLVAPDIVVPAMAKIKASRGRHGWPKRVIYVAAAAASIVICIGVVKFLGAGTGKSQDERYFSMAAEEMATDNVTIFGGSQSYADAQCISPETRESAGVDAGTGNAPSICKESGSSLAEEEGVKTVYFDVASAEQFLQKLCDLCGVSREGFVQEDENGYIVDISGKMDCAAEAFEAQGIEIDLTDITQINIVLYK